MVQRIWPNYDMWTQVALRNAEFSATLMELLTDCRMFPAVRKCLLIELIPLTLFRCWNIIQHPVMCEDVASFVYLHRIVVWLCKVTAHRQMMVDEKPVHRRKHDWYKKITTSNTKMHFMCRPTVLVGTCRRCCVSYDHINLQHAACHSP